MYQAYWGFSRSPFAASSAGRTVATSPIHTEALARLEFLLESQSRFGLLMGPAGSGKSLVLSQFAQRAARGGALVAAASALVPAGGHFFAAAADGWQLDGINGGANGGAADCQAIANRLQELSLENLSAVLLIDDLDRAGSDTAGIIEWLVSLPDVPLTVVAVARAQSAERINPRLLDQVALRIDLTPWNDEETRDYLASSLASAGRVQPAFDEAATRRLVELSGGIPRRVNRLAELALVAGAGQQLARIDRRTVEAVMEELSV
jgi:type II secretory pathway predicted ATPase ExeA